MDLFFMCILLSFSGIFTKYVYIEDEKNWQDALTHCRQQYTDLAPVSNEQDNLKLQQLSGILNSTSWPCIWIGAERNCSNREQWLWSGGGVTTTCFWSPGEPNDCFGVEDSGCLQKSGWNDANAQEHKAFFCYRAVVVEEQKTWEEALEYCREHHDDLASVASETEMLLIQRELKKHNPAEHVWIGLHFFSLVGQAGWLWVDRQEMDYEAWDEGGKPACPDPRMECAAIQVTEGTEGVWGAHDCEEKLNFVCY
ncbi:snaclec subunit B-like [Haplochromis burtoni]|uniref:snaclec subunit B-like n=1 Tax=Haplochromis burtoni TaxID=8153 RepID=UPI001C2CDABB|nr:snaclec subunit B-like [Haplochromis burtoni]